MVEWGIQHFMMQIAKLIKFFEFAIRVLFTNKQYISAYLNDIYELKLSDNDRLVIFDYDQTLADMHGPLPEKSRQLLQRLLDEGRQVVIFSNTDRAFKLQLKKIISDTRIYVEPLKNKPLAAGFEKILNKYKVKAENTVMIGDVIATDMFGAYQAGIGKRILVAPYTHKHGGEEMKGLLKYANKLEKWLYFRKNHRDIRRQTVPDAT